MASIIQIKRSTGTGAPGSLAPGELAYSYGDGTSADLGSRLFFGKGDDGAGSATSVVVIGGQYFSDMLDHTPGTLTASSAIVTDANSKIDNLKVDNLDLNGNTISSTNLNGNIVLDPNGTGSVDVAAARITNLGSPVNSTDAATKGYIDNSLGGISTVITIAGDTGETAEIVLADSEFSIVGGTGISTVVSDGNSFAGITINLDNTAVSAGTYGSATSVPGFTVDAQGRITGVSTYAIDNIDSAAVVQEITKVVDVEFLNNLGITASTLDGETASDFHDYAQLTGAPTTVSSFTNDAGYAVLANLTTEDVPEGATPTNLYYTTARFDSDFATQTTDDIATEGSNLWYTNTRATDAARAAVSATTSGNGALSYNSTTGVFAYAGPTDGDIQSKITAGTGVAVSGGVVSIGQAVGTTNDVVFNDIRSAGNVQIDGNLQVNGTTTTINSQTLEIADNMIYLNSGESAQSGASLIDVGWAANVKEGTDPYQHVGFFRDATDGTFKVYKGYTPEPGVEIVTGHASFALAPFAASTLTGDWLGFDTAIAALTTDDIATEGSNLWYTDTRATDAARAAITFSGNGISYNSGTGVITTSDASTSVKGVASFSSNDFAVSSGAVTIKASGVSNTQLVNSTIGIATQSGSTTIGLGATLTINGDGGAISTSLTGGTATIAVATATDTVNGVASFASSNFTVVAGAVTTDAISISGNSGAGASINNGGSLAITATASSGVVVEASAGGVAINVANATKDSKGTAQFDSDAFTVIGGYVTINTVDGGTF
jgi:trimeric autotransporter adhesin